MMIFWLNRKGVGTPLWRGGSGILAGRMVADRVRSREARKATNPTKRKKGNCEADGRNMTLQRSREPLFRQSTKRKGSYHSIWKGAWEIGGETSSGGESFVARKNWEPP